MEKTEKTSWAIQTEVDSKKYLTWNWKGGKLLYWTADKKSPPPILFETKADAYKSLKKHDKAYAKEKTPRSLRFKNYMEGSAGKPVKVKIQIF